MKKKTLFFVLATIILLAIFQPTRAFGNQDSTIKIIGSVRLNADHISHNYLSPDIKEKLKNFAQNEGYFFINSSSFPEKIILEAIKEPWKIKKLSIIKPTKRIKNIGLIKGIFVKGYAALRFNPTRNVLEILSVEKGKVEKTCIPIIVIITLTLVIFKKIFSILSDKPKDYGWKRRAKRIKRNETIFFITTVILLLLFIRLLLFAFSYGSETIAMKFILIISILGIADNLVIMRNKWTTTLITIILSIGLLYIFCFL